MKLDEMEKRIFKGFHESMIYLIGDGLFIEDWSEFKKKDVKDRIKEIKEMVDLLNEEKRWLKDILNRQASTTPERIFNQLKKLIKQLKINKI